MIPAVLFLSAVTAVLLELAFGTWGLFLPALAILAFYGAVTYGWRAATVTAILSATVLDVVLGHEHMSATLLMIPITGLAVPWRTHGTLHHTAVQVVIGFAVGLLYSAGLVVSESLLIEHWNWALVRHNALLLLEAAALGALLFPVLVLVLDGCGAVADLPTYRNAGTPGGRHGR